jgi:hypothetical protein
MTACWDSESHALHRDSLIVAHSEGTKSNCRSFDCVDRPPRRTINFAQDDSALGWRRSLLRAKLPDGRQSGSFVAREIPKNNQFLNPPRRIQDDIAMRCAGWVDPGQAGEWPRTFANAVLSPALPGIGAPARPLFRIACFQAFGGRIAPGRSNRFAAARKSAKIKA